MKLSVLFQRSRQQAVNEKVRFVLHKYGEEEPFGFPFLTWLKYSITLLHTKDRERLVLKHSCCSKDSENARVLEWDLLFDSNGSLKGPSSERFL